MSTTPFIAKNLLLGFWLSVLALTAHTKPITQPVTLCNEDEDVFPWTLKNGKGLDLHLVEQAAAKAGIALKVHTTPWRRCLLEIESGQVDGGFSASYKEDRAKFAVYPSVRGKPDASRRLHNDTYSLYRALGSSLDWNGREFSGLTGTVGVPGGYSIGDDLKKLGVKIDDASKTAETNFLKLVAGRVQAVAALTMEADRLIKSNPDLVGKVEKIKTPLVEKPYFLIFGKAFYTREPKLVEDFWTMVATVRKSAEYRAKESAALNESRRVAE